MTPARFRTIEEIFRAALDQEPGLISTFLDTACEGDELLRRKVEALLASRQRAARFIETSAAGVAMRIIENGQADPLVGQTFGHYKISKQIGRGGMGEVYLATDVTAGRKAALKLLPMRFTEDAERLRRFQQEAHTVVALNHPNIVTVYEIGEDHSIHYIASELIEGETLRQRLTRGPMEFSEAVEIAIQVASALAAAHQAGIVHRDIKPENIMLRPDGYAKVLDFGIAKLAEQELPVTTPRDEAFLLVETNLASILGTVRYMSPEQTCGTRVDKTTDIWSLGIVLYEMVTGHAPFTGETPEEVMSAIFEKEPPPLTSYVAHTPGELQQIISTTLRKDHGQRYHSAHELRQALKALRHKLEVEAELKRSAAAASWLHWIRSPAALALGLLMAALALALPFYWHRNLTTTSPPEKSVAVLPFENLKVPAQSRSLRLAKVSPATTFDLYTPAQNLLLTVGLSATGKANLLQAVDLLNQAVARDPSFFQAYCKLAEAHDILYFFGYDHTSARLALAEAAIQAAFRLRPGAAEAHLARALNLYQGYLDYEGALAELELARQTLPNAPRIFELTGWIQRRQGRWKESTRNLEHAIELDPRNIQTLQETALSYHFCRRYAEEKSLLDRVLAVVPNDVATKVARAFVEFASRADTRPLHQVIDSISATRPGELSSAASYWLMCVLGERDTPAANTVLIALGENPSYLGVADNVIVNHAFAEGVIARMSKDDAKAAATFTAARAEQEKVVQAEPNYAPTMCVLGLIDAGLGRKEEALREGRRAVELLPVEKNALDGNMMVKYLAMIAAWVGDKDLACEQLAIAIRRPSDLSYGQLKLLPYWDSLRGDPRFEELVEEAKNPVTLK